MKRSLITGQHGLAAVTSTDPLAEVANTSKALAELGEPPGAVVNANNSSRSAS